VTTFYHGDTAEYRVRNTGKVAVDVTVLYINSRFGIVPLFPESEDNRVEAGKEITIPPVDVDRETAGLERVVVLAVRAEDRERVDFTGLASPTIEGVREVAKKRAGMERGLRTPLGRLLQKAMLGEGDTPRMKRKEIENYSIGSTPVLVVEGLRPPGQKD
jgi:hypothetical protein